MHSMKNFSQIVIDEAKLHEAHANATAMLQSEITNYIRKVNRVMPQNIKDIVAISQRLNLTSADQLDKIRNANKSQFAKVAKELSISDAQVSELHELLKKAGKSIRMLPQYQTDKERAEILAGQASLSDMTIDLETPAGRNAVIKMYMPIVYKIADQYVGKSRLDRPSLIDAGTEGLVNAMNTWDREKGSSFRTFASYTIQHAILDEINAVGHTLSGTNWYAEETFGAAMLDAVSLDGFLGDNDDDFDQDHLKALGAADGAHDYEGEEKRWKEVYKMIEDKFSARDVDIFYRYFGLGPYYGQRQKVKDIAKKFGMSDGNIQNSIISKILKFLRTNPKAASITGAIKDAYTESVALEHALCGKGAIKEALYDDNVYMMLESITRWNDKKVLERAVLGACDKLDIEDAKFILDCLTKGIDVFNAGLRKNRRMIVFFLSEVYPTENMSRKKDADLAEYMEELISATKMLNIEW